MSKDLSQAEQRVKAYLEEQIKSDSALAGLYAPSKIKECYEYIRAQAKKKASAGSYFADDAEVWKWARDFYIEVLPKKAEKLPKEIAEKKDSAQTVKVDSVKLTDNVVKDIENDVKKASEIKTEPMKITADKGGISETKPCNHQKEEKNCKNESEAEDDVYFDGQSYNKGDIIDKVGRKLNFEDFKPDLRFVEFTDSQTDFYNNLVFVVTKIDKDVIHCRFSNNQTFCMRHLFTKNDVATRNLHAISKDAKIIGRIENNCRRMFEESDIKTVNHQYDEEGNGLLFGF